MTEGYDYEAIKEQVCSRIQKLFDGDHSGHDFWHSIRVYHNALRIAEGEACDRLTVMLAALLHDADDVKLFRTENYENARRIMTECGISTEIQRAVVKAVSSVSFRGTGGMVPETAEGKIVQDADRLDALGAIGIARTFAYGGSHAREIYCPDEKPKVGMSEEEYRNNKGSSINHFYEKLFLLKELMNTDTGRKMAEERDTYMRKFVDEFMIEWNGGR